MMNCKKNNSLEESKKFSLNAPSQEYKKMMDIVLNKFEKGELIFSDIEVFLKN